MRSRSAPRSSRVLTASLLVGVFILASCQFVYPAPPAGDPIPQLLFSLSEPEPVAGEFIVTVTPANFDPAKVVFRLDDPLLPVVGTDSSAPFTLTLDTRDLPAGPHEIWATARDDDYLVRSVFRLKFIIRPNIVTILVDDLDETGTPYWDAMPKTRALIADQGLTFSNMFITDPVCCPSRASLMTGRYPHNTGVFDNTPPDGGYETFAAGAQSDTLALRLQAEGYRTGFLGKYLNGYDPLVNGVPPGWDEWFGLDTGVFWSGYGYNANHNGTLEFYGWNPEDYETDVLAQHATSFIDDSETDDTTPFYLSVNPLAPHFNVGPAPRHQPNPFGAAPLPTPPNFNEADVSDKPTWLRDGFPLVSQAEIDLDTAKYRTAFGSLLAVDDMVSAIVDRLEQQGELDRTIFLFLSDNGMNRRSHRLGHKMAPYEESIRVPFLMTGPGVPVGAESSLVTNIDIAPTLLHLAGAGEQDDLDGRSFVPLLQGNPTGWRSDFLIEFRGTYGFRVDLDTLADVQNEIAASGSLTLVPTYRAVRTDQWLYVEWYGGTVHEYELYDITNDPYQLTNLLSTPQGVADNAALTASLQVRIEELATCAGATCRN